MSNVPENYAAELFIVIIGSLIGLLQFIIISALSTYKKTQERQWKKIESIDGRLSSLEGEHRAYHSK